MLSMAAVTMAVLSSWNRDYMSTKPEIFNLALYRKHVPIPGLGRDNAGLDYGADSGEKMRRQSLMKFRRWGV